MRKPGKGGAPGEDDFKKAAKTAKTVPVKKGAKRGA